MDERTTEILNRFHNSWTEVEKYFDDLIDNYPGFERLRSVRHFITELKEKGESNFFRLGTSIHILILSRSAENGLRPDQKHIKIDTIADNDFEVTLKDRDRVYRQYRISNLNDVRLTNLIQTLKHTLVD